jgi:hypothetical protein
MWWHVSNVPPHFSVTAFMDDSAKGALKNCLMTWQMVRSSSPLSPSKPTHVDKGFRGRKQAVFIANAIWIMI